MIGAREMFSELSHEYIDVEVVLGDNTIIRAVGCGTITFQRESMSPMTSRDALEEISTQNGPFNFNSNSMSSCVNQ